LALAREKNPDDVDVAPCDASVADELEKALSETIETGGMEEATSGCKIGPGRLASPPEASHTTELANFEVSSKIRPDGAP
jgi:hypothetical protein